MTAPATVAAVILAAGRSSRMGHPKLLADVGGTPMLRRVVQAALGSPARPILVVTGHEAAAVAHSLEGLDVGLVHNAEFAAGLSTSLKAGIAALPAGIDGAVVLLGDMPQVTAAHISALLAAFAPGLVVVPVHAGRRGNPILWPREAFARIASLSGDAGAKRLLAEFADLVREVEIASPAIFRDIDTPEALAALRAEIAPPGD
ncbi:MAG: nucleotidyltransferase family protein [Hyphomicrobiaceae bacterium]|nr:nucleotidyltransferase family protein [Hyphomicrobiaceae bacterium]